MSQPAAFPGSLHGARRQSGFSLVELMVTLLLGSLISIAAVQLFATNQRTFLLQQGLTDVQEQGRFALEYIARDMRRMGHRITGLPDTPGIVLAAGANYLASDEGGDAAIANDRLTFSFHGDIGVLDCEGDAVAGAATTVVNMYWVQDSELRCRGSNDAGTTGLVIASGVDSFQVLYGVDPNADGIPFASRYEPASALAADDQIVAVRIGLLVRTLEGDEAQMAASPDFVVLDKQLAGGAAPLDVMRVRRLFTTTVKARNYTWEEI